jgi:hypothetical protein
MREATTAKLLEGLREAAKNLPDRRKGSNGTKYKITDFLMSAFSVFYSALGFNTPPLAAVRISSTYKSW